MSVDSIPSKQAAEDREALARILGIAVQDRLAQQPQLLRATRLLAEQVQGIDYASLGLSWDHPESRTQYRAKKHPSFNDRRSRARTEKSHRQLKEIMTSEEGMTEEVLVATFVREIGVQAEAPEGAALAAVLAALEEELVLPLRALHEAGDTIYRTFGMDAPIPKEPIDRCVADITAHVLRGDFSEWRYSNPVGKRQLEGLSEEQIARWAESSRTQEGPLVVHEGAPGELDYFWATKIGGPSHGFDYEAECLLPLLANARHKVLLISDPAWPHHPAGRAHFRLLWTNTEDPSHARPVLWLEAVHSDYHASCNTRSWQPLVIQHVLNKAIAIGAMASWDSRFHASVEAAVKEMGLKGKVKVSSDNLVLRPSNGVVEASDYLGGQHDWVQMHRQVVGPFRRCVFVPANAPE